MKKMTWLDDKKDEIIKMCEEGKTQREIQLPHSS